MSTVKHLSYAGITVPLSPSWLEEKYLRIIKNEYSFTFADFFNYDNFNPNNLSILQLPKLPEFSLGKLYWPNDAGKPAWFHIVVNGDILNKISAIAASSNYNTFQSLLLYDGSSISKTITAQMISLPPKPLAFLGNDFTDLWLLTLTDQRFYWYWSTGNITQPSSWANLYTQIGSILGVTINYDTINSNYSTPSTKWVIPYLIPTPTILDAVANQIGQRVVVGLDGSVKTVNWETARSAAQNYVNNINGRVISGGLILEKAIAGYVPSAVQVVFQDASVTPPKIIPIVETNTLIDLGISEYLTGTGIPGYTQTLYADLVYTGSNGGAVSNYATQASIDWYGWRLMDTDLVYPGIEPWVPTGWEESIEWELKLIEQNPLVPNNNGLDDPFTKTQIKRGPWTDVQVGNFLTSTPNSSGGSGTGYPNPYPEYYEVNSEPAVAYTYYLDPGSDTTSTSVTIFQMQSNGGNTSPPSVIQQYQWYPTGTSNPWAFLQSVETNSSAVIDQYQQGYQIDSIPLYQTVFVESGNITQTLGSQDGTQGIIQQFQQSPDGTFNVIQMQWVPTGGSTNGGALFQTVQPISGGIQSTIGNYGGTQGFIQQFQQSSGNITSIEETISLYNGSSVETAAMNYTVNGSTITQTYPAMKVDFSSATVIGVGSTIFSEASITAAGTNAGTATACTAISNTVTVPSNNNGVILQNIAGPQVIIQTSTTNTLIVYPPSGATINGNSSITIAPGLGGYTGNLFWRATSTKFVTV